MTFDVQRQPAAGLCSTYVLLHSHKVMLVAVRNVPWSWLASAVCDCTCGLSKSIVVPQECSVLMFHRNPSLSQSRLEMAWLMRGSPSRLGLQEIGLSRKPSLDGLPLHKPLQNKHLQLSLSSSFFEMTEISQILIQTLPSSQKFTELSRGQTT